MPLTPISQWLFAELASHGLWPEEAAICTDYLTTCKIEGMTGRWDEDWQNFSTRERCELRARAFRHVLQWIEANKPDHLAKANIRMALL